MEHPYLGTQSLTYILPEDQIHRAKSDNVHPDSMPLFGQRNFNQLTFPKHPPPTSAYGIFKRGNEIFGYDGWSTQIQYTNLVDQSYDANRETNFYTVEACIRVKLKNGVCHDGYGTHTADTYRKASSAAITDATKDALMRFSTTFGHFKNYFDTTDFTVNFDPYKPTNPLTDATVILKENPPPAQKPINQKPATQTLLSKQPPKPQKKQVEMTKPNSNRNQDQHIRQQQKRRSVLVKIQKKPMTK